MTDNLRHLFADSPENTIDLDAVVRRSRARRLPKILGIGVAGALALGGVVTVSIQALPGLGGEGAADTTAAGPAPESAQSFDLNSTGIEESKMAGLLLEVGEGSATEATLRLINAGTETVDGEITGVSVTLQAGDTLASSAGDREPLEFVLMPGETLTLTAPYPVLEGVDPSLQRQVSAIVSGTLGPDRRPLVIEGMLAPSP